MRGRGVSGRRRRLRPVHRPRIDRRLAPSAAVEQRPIKDGARWRSVRFWWFPGGGMCCGRMYAGQIDFRQPRRSGGQGDLNFRWTTRHRSLHLCGPRWAGEEILATNQSTRFYYTIAVFRDMQPTRRLDTPRANDIVMTEVEGQTLARIVPLYCLMILRWWQTGQGDLRSSNPKVSSDDRPPRDATRLSLTVPIVSTYAATLSDCLALRVSRHFGPRDYSSGPPK
jgi:hypothetical protein